MAKLSITPSALAFAVALEPPDPDTPVTASASFKATVQSLPRSRAVLLKVQTTRPERYAVSPPITWVAGGRVASVDVDVTLLVDDGVVAAAEQRRHDTFLIQWLEIDDAGAADDVSPDELAQRWAKLVAGKVNPPQQQTVDVELHLNSAERTQTREEAAAAAEEDLTVDERIARRIDLIKDAVACGGSGVVDGVQATLPSSLDAYVEEAEQLAARFDQLVLDSLELAAQRDAKRRELEVSLQQLDKVKAGAPIEPEPEPAEAKTNKDAAVASLDKPPPLGFSLAQLLVVGVACFLAGQSFAPE